MEATNACEPSPPAIPRQSAPSAIASRASLARSSPRSRNTVCTPRSAAICASANFSTLPPPDQGLHSSTGLRGRRCSVPCRRSSSCRPGVRAIRAVTEAIAIRPTRARIRIAAASAWVAVPTTATPMITTPTAMAQMPMARRGLRSVTIHQPPPTTRASPIRPPTSHAGLLTTMTTAEHARNNTLDKETIAAHLRLADGVVRSGVTERPTPAAGVSISGLLPQANPRFGDQMDDSGRQRTEVPVRCGLGLGQAGNLQHDDWGGLAGE